MRHLGTVLAAAVVGPLAWVLFAVGQDRSARAFENVPNGGVPDGADLIRPVLVLAAGGILLGLIATLRFSPLGAALAGLGYSVSYLGLLVSPNLVTALLDHRLSLGGYQVDLMAPVRSGTTLLVGSLMLVGVVSVRRWRRWPQPAADTPDPLAPDEILPATTGPDRPLGGDGLGLDRPAGSRPDGPDGPDGTSPGGRPEPEPAGAGGSSWAGRADWADLVSGGAGRRSRVSSDWMRRTPR